VTTTADNVWLRVGVEPEARLRWLLRFGNLERASLTDKQGATVRQEVRAFVVLQEIDPALRGRMRSWPAPADTTPDLLTDGEIGRAHRWIKGLGLLSIGEKWTFAPRIKYELDAYRGMLRARLRANTRLEQFKALAYDAFREARFKFRVCPHCRRAFVPVGRQAYCSSRCSQAVRTRKWRKAHPEKNRAIRRAQYRKAMAASLKLSKLAAIEVVKPRQRSRD